MSKTLIIKHLPKELSYQDKEQLLRHFGAEAVWETKSKRNYIFASFSTIEKAKASLLRLHQLEIAKRRLVVEYSFNNEAVPKIQEDAKNSSESTKLIKDFLKLLNAWNPSVDFYQPPPVNVSYKYPDINPNIVLNIIHALFNHKPFYVQTLHLMNKMCLEVPFSHNEDALLHFKENFRQFFLDEIISLPEESEIESEQSGEDESYVPQPKLKLLKRKHTLPVTRKRPAAVLSTASIPKKSKKADVYQDDVFENVTPKGIKKIAVVVTQNALLKPSQEPEVIGELGKFDKEEPVQLETVTSEPEQPSISKAELLQNRISHNDMRVLPVFKNYHPGQPSMRLYVKNLAKTVTNQDLTRIYRRYIENLSEDELNGFDVRVMQEGRMKGQAFVTFPSEILAEKALKETNGYLLKEKPMVVQFARAANKKSVE